MVAVALIGRPVVSGLGTGVVAVALIGRPVVSGLGAGRVPVALIGRPVVSGLGTGVVAVALIGRPVVSGLGAGRVPVALIGRPVVVSGLGAGRVAVTLIGRPVVAERLGGDWLRRGGPVVVREGECAATEGADDGDSGDRCGDLARDHLRLLSCSGTHTTLGDGVLSAALRTVNGMETPSFVRAARPPMEQTPA